MSPSKTSTKGKRARGRGRKAPPSPIDLLREQYKDFKQGKSVAVEDADLVPCAICGDRDPKKYMVNLGKGLKNKEVQYRHDYCYTGSPSWLKHCKDSPWWKYYQSDEESGG